MLERPPSSARCKRGRPLRWPFAPASSAGLALLLVVAGVLACWVNIARASFGFTKPGWDSTTMFLEVARERIGRERVVLGAQLDWSQLTPADAVIVFHPETTLQFTEVSAFLSSGGRLALLDDFGRGDRLLSRFHIQRVSAPSKPLESLAGNPRLQLARPTPNVASTGSAARHSMVNEVDYVATNHPTTLAPDPSIELTPVLSLADERGQHQHLAVIGVIGDAVACGLEDGTPRNPRSRCGRLFALGDPSVFIDLMMQFEGNRQLAENLIEYLLEDDAWGARGGRLFIVSNAFDQTGNFGGSSDLERKLDAALDDAAEWLRDARSDGLPDRVAWIAAMLLCIAAAIAVLRTSGKPYTRPTPSYAARTSVLAMGGVAGRAAMLSASSTQGALVLLEMKTALEAFLRERLQLAPGSSSQEILAQIDKRGVLGLGPKKRLERIFERMAEAERAVLGAETARLSRESIKDIHTDLMDMVEQIEKTRRRAN